MTAEIAQGTKKDIDGEICCLESLHPDRQGPNGPLQAFKTTHDPGTMHLDDAMNELDAPQFMEAMVREVMDHINGKQEPFNYVEKGRPKGSNYPPCCVADATKMGHTHTIN
jgi:hypothetical protein